MITLDRVCTSDLEILGSEPGFKPSATPAR
jgi:hypothetical protein